MSGLAVPARALASYLGHVTEGRPLRDVGAEARAAASTVLRHVRRCEALRDHPEWDLLFTRLEARWIKHPVQGVLTREDIAAALGVTEVEVHAALATVLPALRTPGALVVCSDEAPSAAVILDDAPEGRLPRSALVCALAFGWLVTAGPPGARLRRFVPTPLAVQADYPPGEGPTSTKEIVAARAPMSMLPIDVLGRNCPHIITADHLEMASYFWRLFTARSDTPATWRRIASAMPARHLSLLEEVIGHGVGLQTVEREMGLPMRSAKILLAFALEAFDHVAVTGVPQ